MGRGPVTAKDIVNTYSEADLERIFREYGDEHQARRVARGIVEARRQAPLTTTGQLKAVIEGAKTAPRGHRGREGRVDPATRVFQALRIEVNQELAGLARFLDQAVRLLEADGRLVVISYHSGEDRIVKHRLRDMAQGEKDRVTGRPLAETRLIEVLTKKPVRPGDDEVVRQPPRRAPPACARRAASESPDSRSRRCPAPTPITARWRTPTWCASATAAAAASYVRVILWALPLAAAAIAYTWLHVQVLDTAYDIGQLERELVSRASASAACWRSRWRSARACRGSRRAPSRSWGWCRRRRAR